MIRKKLKQIGVILLCMALLTACGSAPAITGEVVEWAVDEAAVTTSLVVQTDSGQRVGILLTDGTIAWPMPWDGLSAADLRFDEQDGVFVYVTPERGRQTLISCDGAELPAYTAKEITVTGVLTANALTLADGTAIDRYDNYIGIQRSYRLADGTELLSEIICTGLEDEGYCFAADLSTAAKESVSVYFKEQGLLYDLPAALEMAYQGFSASANKAGFNSYTVGQDILATVSGRDVAYFLTSVTLPVDGSTCNELRLGAAFDKTSGARIDAMDLFTCGRDELLDIVFASAGITDAALQAEMKAAFRP